MTVIDPNTGLLITCEPWEYAELCKQHGWIKTGYETNTTSIQKYDFTTNTIPNKKHNFIPPEEKAEIEWVKKAKEENDIS